MNPIVALLAVLWMSFGISVAINVSEKQKTLKEAVIMTGIQVMIVFGSILPLLAVIANAS